MNRENPFPRFILVLSIILSGFVYGCTSSGPAAAAQPEPERGYTTLLDMLRYEPQLNISGSGSNPIIRIRGNKTIYGDNEPLFVLNGTPLGNGYSSASSIDVNEVASIRVLSASQSGLYGARGGNGVILIQTK